MEALNVEETENSGDLVEGVKKFIKAAAGACLAVKEVGVLKSFRRRQFVVI